MFGLILLLPLLGWILTGMVFLIKPGYAAAYEQIRPKLYALENSNPIPVKNSWLEVRFFRTILGDHLLAKMDGKWQHFNAKSLKLQVPPTAKQEALLLSDAISHNNERYGNIKSGGSGLYITSTGVELSLNWDSLSISQKGHDTQLINTLYKIHYLQWLGHKKANIVLGVMGLLLLTLLVCYGVILYVRRRCGASHRRIKD